MSFLGVNIHKSINSVVSNSVSNSGIVMGTNSNTTTTISSGNLVYSGGSITLSSGSTYHILGEDYTIKNSHLDTNLALMISTLNVLKRPFWEELKKQSIKFDEDLENFIEKRLRIYDRDEKLESLLPPKS